MRATELLHDVEPLTHGERCRRLAEVARRPELGGVLDELSGGGQYERIMALRIAAGRRDGEYLARAARDPDPEVAGRAIAALARYGLAPEVFGELLEDAPAATRALVYRAIRANHRTDLAERVIDRVRERWGDDEAVRLLPVCGTEAVASRLGELAYAVPSWKALARAHPGLMLDHAERELADLPGGLRQTWWYRHESGMTAATPHDPHRVIDLLERYGPPGQLPGGRLGALLDADPARVIALLLAPGRRSGFASLMSRRAIRDRMARLGEAELALVARAAREDTTALVQLLRAFPPSRREAVYDLATAGVEPGQLAGNLLDVLPHARREREAARMLRLRPVAEHPERTLWVTAFLRYASAAETLRAATRRSDADERAKGYHLLIDCAGRSRSPEVLTELLESLTRLRNEQDPVRRTAIAALADLPPGVFRTAHLPALTQFVDDALAARDTSYDTRYGLVRLATRVFEDGAVRGEDDLTVFALETFDALVGHLGAIYLGRLDRMLRHGQEHELVRRLVPHLVAQARRDEHRMTFVLADALGRRGHDVPELQDALERALDAKDDMLIRRAIEYWLAPPRTRAERVTVLLNRDRSYVEVPRVFDTIATVRTDLLTPILTGKPPGGRFWRSGVTFVPIAGRAAVRHWTADQRGAYLKLLHRLADGRKVPEAERAQAIRAIGQVPGVTAAELGRYLRSDDVFLRRAALTAAAWTATPQDVLGDLLSYASSDDAHVAVYAATRAARFTRPSALGAALGPVLADGKVTARKEALRLLVRNRCPDAPDLLAAAWDKPEQHPDVRIAIASAVREFLADPVSRRILTEATAGPRDLARQVLGTAPETVAAEWRPFYAGLIVRVAESADKEARSGGLATLPSWARWAPEAPAILAARFADLDETAWYLSGSGAVRCAMNGYGVAALRDTAAALAAAPLTHDAEAERDRPARQRLSSLAVIVRDLARRDRAGAAEVVREVSGVLPEPSASWLIAATMDWTAPALAALATRPIGGTLAVAEVADGLGKSLRGVEPESVLPHAVDLAERDDLAGGLFACELAADCGPRAGWPPAWRDLLRRLRQHPDPEVVHSAAATHTAAE